MNSQSNLPNIDQVIDYLQALQNVICAGLEQADGQSSFVEDIWQREQGGGGQSRVLTNGAVFEQAGVNFSYVTGDKMPA